MPEPVIFEKAAVLCYRIFDIAQEIDLEIARKLLAEDTRRLKLSREGSQYLQLPNPPLTVEMGKRELPLRRGAQAVDVVFRVYDYGAASVILQVLVPPGTSMQELIVLADELYDSESVDRLSRELVDGLRQGLHRALQGGQLWEQNESYTVTFVEKVRGEPTASQLLECADLARLLLGEIEGEPLSEREKNDVIQNHFSYRENDLVVIDWNSAFVYEPSGSRDIPDILEIGNAQLLEFRFYDDLYDTNIRRIYDEVQARRRTWHSIFRSPYKVLARRVLATVLEMSEFIERVENSLKIIGDFYLAKVYEAAVRRLRIPVWQATVTRKQQLLANVYQLLKGEVDTDRAFTLEFAIAILIVTELLVGIASLLRH